ncbi:hypothetical protein NJ7G_2280 [Natrinema sp. J7-2]|nr:hypothetical protein NJ7G_2280 [Natrinema sp. J7-2]
MTEHVFQHFIPALDVRCNFVDFVFCLSPAKFGCQPGLKVFDRDEESVYEVICTIP